MYPSEPSGLSVSFSRARQRMLQEISGNHQAKALPPTAEEFQLK